MTVNFRPVLEERKRWNRKGAWDDHRRRWAYRAGSAAFAVLTCLVLAVDAPAQRNMYDGWRDGHYMMPWNMGWFGSILMFALWIALFVAVFFFVKRWIQTSQKENPDLTHRPSAMDILRERYARGEIDKEEFEEKKRVLKDNP